MHAFEPASLGTTVLAVHHLNQSFVCTSPFAAAFEPVSLWPYPSPSRRRSSRAGPRPQAPVLSVPCGAGLRLRLAFQCGGGGSWWRREPPVRPGERPARACGQTPAPGGRVARWHGTGWVHAAGGKDRLNFLYL
jgi:hypothetical protein